MQGDLRYFDPGEAVPVLLLAHAADAVADRGQAVELVDEADGQTRVQLVQTAGDGVGALTDRPTEYDADAGYADGDVSKGLL